MCRLRNLKCIECGYNGTAHENKCPRCESGSIYEIPFPYIPEYKDWLIDESI